MSGTDDIFTLKILDYNQCMTQIEYTKKKNLLGLCLIAFPECFKYLNIQIKIHDLRQYILIVVMSSLLALDNRSFKQK